MKEVYGKFYYKEYSVGCGNVDYADSRDIKDFLAAVALRIVEDLKPKTVLDAGCAMGHLVAALRDLGVEAYGIDISEYAVNNAREDIRPFLYAQSLTEPLPSHFPQKFDLITNIEVIEHMRMDEGIKAIKVFASAADTVIFSSTSDDFEDPTHVNVQQPEYWVETFARYGFYNKTDYRPNYISSNAICFYKTTHIAQVLGNYERNIKLFRNELAGMASAKALSTQVAVIRYDMGEGFSEINSTFIEYNNHTITAKINIDHSCIAVRFDPVENAGCLMQSVITVTNVGPIEFSVTDGYSVNDILVFANDDPQIIFDVSKGNVRWIELSATIYPINNIYLLNYVNQSIGQSDWLKILSKDAKVRLEDTELKLEDTEFKLENTDLKLKDTDLKLKDTDLKLKDTDLKLKDTKLKLVSTERKLNIMIEETEYQNNEVLSLEKSQKHILEQLSEEHRVNTNFQEHFHAISNSFFWKITKPARWLLDALKSILGRFPLLYKGLVSLRYSGIKETGRKVKQRGIKADIKSLSTNSFFLSDKERLTQKSRVFEDDVCISILVPLYNTNKQHLVDMIASVIAQTYANWELCLVDASNGDFAYVGEYCQALAKKDNRIKYQKLGKNLGISENTNVAIKMSTGDYISLLDHDDMLHESALYENRLIIEETNADFIYSDELTFEETLENIVVIHYKPDFAPDNLRANNYICHFSSFSKKLQKKSGLFRSEFDGSQDHDMIFRLTEQADIIKHIPKVLYFWRSHEGSVAQSIGAKPYVIEAGINAVKSHLDRIKMGYTSVEETFVASTYKINYRIKNTPLISIIIPNKDEANTLRTCINSILLLSTYKNYEIIIVENNSSKDNVFILYEELERDNENIKIVTWEGTFNYSAINNFAIQFALGEHFVLLNNDVEVISGNWLEEMLMFSQRPDVGAVGAKLYYPDNTIQHGGVVLGIGGVACHAFLNFPREHPGYMGRLAYAHNVSIVTGACLMVKASVYHEVKGLDPVFNVAFNDVDFCLRIRGKGYLNIFTPFAELFHYESKTRGRDDVPERINRFHHEIITFRTRWRKELKNGDPYYNPNLTNDSEDFSYK